MPGTKIKTGYNENNCHISVMIVNYRSWAKLADCLRSLQCIDTSKITLDIIVVDNCSNYGQFETFSATFPAVRFILNSGNHGLSHGCNAGAKAVLGQYFLFINPDTSYSRTASTYCSQRFRTIILTPYYLLIKSHLEAQKNELNVFFLKGYC